MTKHDCGKLFKTSHNTGSCMSNSERKDTWDCQFGSHDKSIIRQVGDTCILSQIET